VTVKNNSQGDYSLHPHGVFYTKANEGAHYADGDNGPHGILRPSEIYTYEWPVPERAGPGPGDGSSVIWPMHSHDHEGSDENTGLIGTIIITARGKARADATPVDVDREFITLFKIFDENASDKLSDNLLKYTEAGSVPVGANADSDGVMGQGPLADWTESNLKHSINGYIFSNLPGLTMRVGERVRWYVFALGSTDDMHTPHWHGNTLLHAGRRMDTVGVFPATSLVADMLPDNPGTWMFHCHVLDHFNAGMTALYTVLPAETATNPQ
jgi:FtsP/CotA-like multicopper oxidase with cupredoxin domain